MTRELLCLISNQEGGPLLLRERWELGEEIHNFLGTFGMKKTRKVFRLHMCDRFDELPLFPYNRGWEKSTQ